MGPIAALSNPCQVEITSGPSCYQVNNGLKINVEEPLAQFYNHTLLCRPAPVAAVKVSHLVDGVEISDVLSPAHACIRFKRTIRVPDDGTIRGQPVDLGSFPILKTEDFEATLPKAMLAKGGLLMPMLQREAMFISFETMKPLRPAISKLPSPVMEENSFALRILTGGVNTISGVACGAARTQQQDYLIVPLQRRLDGYVAKEGDAMRQFVAMPLGSGYSVESQVTGVELGGLQLECVPRLICEVLFGLVGTEKPKVPLDVMRTPQELGLTSGQSLVMTPVEGAVREHPWDWDEAENCILEWRDGTKHDDGPGIVESPKPPMFSRPAYVSDLFQAAGLPVRGPLVLAATPPITVQVHDEFETGFPLQVSPFDDAVYVESRIIAAVIQKRKQRYQGPGKMSSYEHSVAINNGRGIIRLARGTKSDKMGHYIPIHSCDIKEGTSIYTARDMRPSAPPPYQEIPSTWEMALAAGGFVKNSVRPDNLGETKWNWKATCMFNVQLLNSVAFESITGFCAPVYPLAYEEYVKAGLPFVSFDDVSPEKTVVKSALQNVKSVGEIDAGTSFVLGVRPRADGVLVVCIICERMLCCSL